MINHPVFGKSEASIITQIEISPQLFFRNLQQEFEDQSDGTNPDIIDEEEKVKEVFLEIPFFSNTNDSDNDGVIDSLDADPNDPSSNSDGDELTDIVEFQSGLNPLSSDSDGDGILDQMTTIILHMIVKTVFTILIQFMVIEILNYTSSSRANLLSE